MTATTSDLIERTRFHLMTGMFEAQNVLSADITAGATGLTFTYTLGGIQEGAVLACGLELMRVWQVTSATGNAVTVQRGYAGTTAAAHTTAELVTVNPRFSDFHILKALNDDLSALSAHGLYQVKTQVLTFDGTARAIDLASDVIDVLEVRYDESGGSKRWPLIDQWTLLHDMSTADFPSGKALRLDRQPEVNVNIRVHYKAPFTALSALTDDVTAVSGLHAEALDIPPLGAAAMMASARDIRRTDTQAQGDTKRANEVPAGTPQGAARTLLSQRQLRIGQEQGRLYQRYPLRRKRLT